ncbi:dioxygenase [Aliiroseovarius crassostreae]|uniref:Dioxygenase n=1 Tax=Aliiroseovarius crassostreae TaxID=154981 RepID=A0A9Q9HDS0_9RHOB|nr:class III extradiol ring-cleavage dioxygenase [Aliiroseovarius crassostreae]UWP94930.1 dioxygenase [Aliiroseovarius crassostreae]
MRQPTYFISHGGGPWPWIPRMRQMFATLERSLAAMPSKLPERPKAVLMISGHWESNGFDVMSSAAPPMVYDYSGFPPETYEITYPAPGDPDLAQRTQDLIRAAGLPSALNAAQGFDHGVFAPMAVMYPKADMPTYQVSLNRTYDPAQHMALGRALAPLRDEGVLIVGSGLSYHNLRLMGPEARIPSTEFDAWLNTAMMLSPDKRRAAILNWETAPSARIAHKEEDHLVPLFAALGAAEEDPASVRYHEEGIFGGVTATSFRFG